MGSSSRGSRMEMELGSFYDAVDDNHVQRTLEAAGDTPVVVDFHAPWCGPCNVISEPLKQAVHDNGKTFLFKINVDDQSRSAAKYEIASLPTVAIFKNGKIVDHFAGTRSEAAIRAFVDKNT
ncbi:thioredoxin 2 [Thoreauomyces humboldtii]|nr:thioredoxin 2 [Thoreauomyces humboldtii]